MLGIHVSTLYRKMQRYRLDDGAPRPPGARPLGVTLASLVIRFPFPLWEGVRG